ncbi:MBL fold metallo-hydrolase [Phenylobacterium montanum]|uniref:MBL fold metallo-hydrolase n=1 Tax=Phenylobacterium montanum TaxID=2823693 RepID=A0A975G049_9CAUL|nr:MBL fold metallo-hydrolase [Caulobacter sp. S6]QUD88356.1 MBL fold metallo-hydrolase [Caulobacter sp. S6]
MATRGGWVRRGAIGAVVVICLLGLAALFAPYVYAELMAPLNPHAITDPQPAVLAKGHMVDDYFAVEPIGPATFAIGEPRYYQQNYAYLIIGQKRAVLFDSGSGTRDIGPVVRSLTRLPVTVIVSHLHFDHLGGIGAFGKLDMIDLPQTRADFDHGRLHPKRYEFMGFEDGLATPSPTVEAWLKPGESLDLGGRSLAVLSTPGHTPSSVALYEPAAHRLFIGDFIYPTTLYAFLPGASLSAYRATTKRLLADLPGDTILWTAHCCRVGEGIAAPWLGMRDVRDLDLTLSRLQAGQLHATGFYPRRYPVNHEMTIETGFPWNNP